MCFFYFLGLQMNMSKLCCDDSATNILKIISIMTTEI